MIPLLVRTSWRNLARDRAAQVMAFVVPIAFFSIFAVIFGGSGMSGGMGRLDVAVVDESHTPTSAALLRALESDSSLHVIAAAPIGKDTARVVLDRARAEAMVRGGDVPAAIVLPAGVDTSVARFDGRGARVEILSDPSNPVAPKMAMGLLQKAAIEVTRQAASEFTGTPASAAPPVDDLMPLRTVTHEVVGRREQHSMVAFYAAGIAVMFLMFSATGAAGALIEETESGTLERVLSSGLGMTRLLASKWVYATTMGLAQLAAMFAWAVLVFRLDLRGHVTGVIVMSLFTAACASAFGLVLATLARTRQQLQGLANIVILSLSALGGSMFPRFLMSETLQKFSYVGFNAWALEGFTQVLWRDAPVAALWPKLLVLAAFTALFLLLARRFARRWETA